MASVIQTATPAEIEYLDDDGQPMSDDTLQYKWMVVIKEGLEALYRNDPNVFVAGDLLWYPVEGRPTIRTAPDAMVAFGRPKGRRGSYKQWMEANVPPHVVFEVLSPGNRAGELERKFEFYEQYGVEEYYLYDPDDGFLEGWQRKARHLKDIKKMPGFVSPRLGIRFQLGRGADNLTIFGPGGKPFLTYAEIVDQRDAEQRRADSEQARADAERARADAEHAQAEAQRQRAADARAERLAARLRELGIDSE